jgi:hypothetical protein
MVPTYRRDGYRLEASAAVRKAQKMPLALWLTQPRFALGINQSLDHLRSILRRLHDIGSYVVIDEVMDQSFPAHLAALGAMSEGPGLSLIRIRSFVKAVGLNGVRLAVIMHPATLRRPIVNALEMLGGAVDVHSLASVASLADDVPRYKTMLATANRQVTRLWVQAERLVRGTPLSINPLVNGYIGSMVADVTPFGKTTEERRTGLLEGCRSVRTPIVLGASFYVAIDPPTETVRLNFFIHPDELLRGVRNILSLWNG